MALEAYTDVPGRPGLSLVLPSDIDVSTRVVSHSRVRSFSKFTAQTKATVHDTGNDATTAEGEYSWLKGGRSGGSVGGYTAITDEDQIILTGMHDEISWHAGTPTGNQSLGTEMAYGGGQRWDRVWEINAALQAAYCVAFGWDVDKALVLHQYWYGKYCSRQILTRAMWPQYVAQVKTQVSAIRVHLAGEGAEIPNPNKYADPVPIKALEDAMAAAANDANKAMTVAPRQVYDPSSKVTFYWVGDRVKAIKDTDRDQFAYTGSPDVGGVIKEGTPFDVNWLFVAGDKREWYLTPYYTRVAAEDTVRISDSKLDNLEAA